MLALVATVVMPTQTTNAATKVTHHYYLGVDYLLTKGKSVTIKNSYVTKWTSENSKIASVNNNGKVVAKKGGVVTITGFTPYGTSYTYDVGVKTSTFIPSCKTAYKVGKDISAGTYVVVRDQKCTSDDAYWSIYNKKKNGKLLCNDLFGHTSIVTLKKGQYFELRGGYAIPLKKAPKSLFTVKNLNKYTPNKYYGASAKVGYGLPAGTYKITLLKGSTYGSINVFNNAKSSSYSYSKNYINGASVSSSKKTATITLKKGQYVYFNGCKLNKIK